MEVFQGIGMHHKWRALPSPTSLTLLLAIQMVSGKYSGQDPPSAVSMASARELSKLQHAENIRPHLLMSLTNQLALVAGLSIAF